MATTQLPDNEANPETSSSFPKWKQKLSSLLTIFILNVSLLLLVGSYVVYRNILPAKADPMVFVKPQKKPIPPHPPARGGEASRSLQEPSTIVIPPTISPPSVIVSSLPAKIRFNTQMPISTSSMMLPSISLPSGTGLAGGSNGGGASRSSPFGESDSSGSGGLLGDLFDLKQTRDQQPTNIGPGGYHDAISKFVASKWNLEILEKYYKSSNSLNATSIFVPIISAADGPKAFGVENEVKPNMYCILYKATASPSQDGTYHFVGTADDILVVRVDGKTVLDGCLTAVDPELRQKQGKFSMTNFNPTCSQNGIFWIGTPFHVAAGQSVDIEILIGEEPGGTSDYFLFIQRDEGSYENQSNGTPLLPIFQLDSTPIRPKGDPMTFPPFSSTLEPWAPTPGGL